MSKLEIPREFLHVMKVVGMGAKKYSPEGWLETDGAGTSHKEMHASMFRHLADSSAGIKADHESGLHPLLHLATRALMLYTRQERGIINSKDEVRHEVK